MTNYKFVNMAINTIGNKSRFSIRESFPNLEPILIPQFGIKIYPLCNIYHTASFGLTCQVGMYSEIGNNVWIGDRVKIGAMCFIPEGVEIRDDAWIGPRCTFTNDRFPPSPKEKWEKTVIMSGARLGAGVTVVCGVVIGEGALVGAGSVVTKNIPAGETWVGVPAQRIRLGGV